MSCKLQEVIDNSDDMSIAEILDYFAEEVNDMAQKVDKELNGHSYGKWT